MKSYSYLSQLTLGKPIEVKKQIFNKEERGALTPIVTLLAITFRRKLLPTVT